MEEASWSFRLWCVVCGHVDDRVVPSRQLQRLSSGGFAPLRCVECASLAAIPVAKPWEPSVNDRRFLRSMRIASS